MMKIGLLFLFFNSLTLLSQNGFKVIQKAEKKIEQGNLDRANKLLNKADSMDYGFCGNAWMEARDLIALNRIKILESKGQYLQAANTLNQEHLFYGSNLDSLKMTYFLKVIDKSKIKSEIDSCINRLYSIDSVDFLGGYSFNVNFSDEPFYLSYETLRNIKRQTFLTTDKNKDLSNLDRFKLAIREQSFYLLLKY